MTTFPAAPALAGHGWRLGAALLDAVGYCVVAGVFGAIGFGVGLIGADVTGDADSSEEGWEVLGWLLIGTFVGVVVGIVVAVVLAVWLVRRPGTHNGQTLGKQILGIREVRAGGGEIGLGLAVLRELAAKWILIWVVASMISAVLGFVDVGLIGLLVGAAIWYVPAFFDDERRALHDRLCGTRVVVAAAQPDPPAVSSNDDLWPAATP